MRVLLSAYACEPGKGSEPGVGWRWAIEIARLGHEVTVLTRENNRDNIEASIAQYPSYSANIEFAYFDFPEWVLKIKRRFNAVHLYYALWQWVVFYKAKQLHLKNSYDLVHHLTFVSIRHFSRLGQLGIPFVLGPLAGGETSPFWLRWHTGWKGGLSETLRDMITSLSRFDPWFRLALNKANRVAVSTSQTMVLIPRMHQEKTRCVLQIGIDRNENSVHEPCDEERYKRILYVGKFLYWKGMSIGIDAMAESLKSDPELTLTMVGQGAEERCWRQKIEQLGIEDKVNWIPWLSQSELAEVYAAHGVFLFPSLHDSGGQVVLEALSNGLPVVCLKLGGPGVIVDDSCGRAVETGHSDYSRLIDEMAQALLDFTQSSEQWREASLRARASTEKWSWAKRVEALGVY